MRKLRALIASSEGGSAIEFAFVAPVFFLVVLGAFEFGRLLWTREAIQETATSAARCMGILQSSCTSSGAYSSTQTTSYIQSLASEWSVAVPTADITLNQNTSCAGLSGFSQVSIKYTFQTVVPGVMKALSGGIDLSVSACFPNQSGS